jgi:hypothetical protein
MIYIGNRRQTTDSGTICHGSAEKAFSEFFVAAEEAHKI